jgi:hypothetical protein
MDSRVPGVDLCTRSSGKADALCGGLTPLMKLVRLALREPKDGALEAREAKVIYVALAPAFCRTGVGMKQFLECCADIDISALQLPPLSPSDGTRLLTGTPRPLGVLGIQTR